MFLVHSVGSVVEMFFFFFLPWVLVYSSGYTGLLGLRLAVIALKF